MLSSLDPSCIVTVCQRCLHHAFRPIMVGVDGRGTVKVQIHRHSAFVKSFRLANDKWPMSVVNMWQLHASGN